MNPVQLDAIEKMLFVLFGAVVASIGAYWGARFKNAAVMKDLEDLKTQNREIRQATKEIESKIDDQIWDRQRKWELKRDSLSELVRAAYRFNTAVMELGEAYRFYWIATEDQRVELLSSRDESLKKWNQASDAFEKAACIALLVIDEKTQIEIVGVSQIAREIAKEAGSGTETDLNVYIERHRKMAESIGRLIYEVRQELGVVSTPQSNESSAAPTP